MTVRSSVQRAIASQAAGFDPDPNTGWCRCGKCVAERAEIGRKYAAERADRERKSAERSAAVEREISEMIQRTGESVAKSRALANAMLEKLK